jgi:segregation and condensation protein B
MDESIQNVPEMIKDVETAGMDSARYQSAIEALLFVSEKPVVLDQLKEVFPELKPSQIYDLLKGLQEAYVNRESGMVIVEIAGGWQMLSNSHAAVYIRAFYKTKSKEKLSRPALESLAIIAYKQPVGRAEVEVIRGVNSDGTIAHLLNKGLIAITGRKEVPGRPFLYGTTKEFLAYFGLKSLEDLPKIAEFNQLGVDVPQVVASQEPAVEVAPQPTPEVLQESVEVLSEPVVEAVPEQTASQENSGQSRISTEALPETSIDEGIS